MRIPVQYVDGNFDYVEADRLDHLIGFRKIMSFKRSDGWVKVPQGPLRGEGGKKYRGPERRGNTKH
jgi:hypothetical protein